MGVTLEAWLAALQALLPPGRALTRDPASVLTRVLSAIGAMFLAAQLKLEALLVEMDPRRAIAMLPDWERLLGLPDKCTPTSELSTQDRQRLTYQRLIEQGGQSRAYFLGLAEQLGEPASWIEEFRQATCNSNCNSALYSQADEFAWRLNFRRAVTNPRIANCNDNCNNALRWAKSSLAECPITERKPAHTNVLFAYAVRVFTPADLQAFHTRASVAWAIDTNGVLRQYAANELRLVTSPAGVVSALREPEATNMLLHSNVFDDPYWSKTRSSVVPNAIVALDGTNTGYKLVEDATVNNNHWVGRTAGLALVNGTNYTFSIPVKAAERTVVTVTWFGLAAAEATFDLVNGTTNKNAAVVAATMTNLGGGRWLISATWKYTGVGSGPIVCLNNGVTTVYAGDGVSGVYVLGDAQLEVGLVATSPIRTTVAPGIRARDEIVLPLDVLAGDSFGAFVDCVLTRSGVSTATLVGAESDAANQRLLGVDANVHSFNNAAQLSLATGFVNGARATAIYAQDATGRGISASGSDAVTDGAVAQPISRLLLGQRALGTDADAAAAMYVHEFRTYRYRPTNAELKTAPA